MTWQEIAVPFMFVPWLLVACGGDENQETESATTAATDPTSSPGVTTLTGTSDTTETSETSAGPGSETSQGETTDSTGPGPTCADVSCSDHGECVNEGGGPVCNCDPGYIADGLACVLDTPALETIVELSLPEHTGLMQVQAPVRSGVPLPRGVLTPADPVALFEGMVRLPTQVHPLSLWPDGSVRWLQVDTVVDLDPDEVLGLALKRLEEAPALANPIVVEELGESVHIDTGPMQVEIGTTRGSGIVEVQVDGETLIAAPNENATDRGPFTNSAYGIRQTSESAPPAGDPAETYLNYVSGSGMPAVEFHRVTPWELDVAVEEDGPLHTVVRVSGAQLTSDGETEGLYTTRYHFWRGARAIDVQHQWVYTGAGSLDPIQSYGYQVPFPSTDRAAEGESADVARLSHLEFASYVRNGAPVSGQAAPVVSARNGERGVAVMLEGMATSFPKALVADSEHLRAELYAEDAPEWDLSRYSNQLGNGENSGSSVGAQGLATGDFLRLEFTSSGFDTQRLLDQARTLNAGPLQIWATPEWYSASEVMGVGPFVFANEKSADVHYRIDRILKLIEEWMRFNRDRFAWFGIEDYGDIRGWFEGGANSDTWLVEGRYGWSGNSGEPSNQLWLQCLRRQSRACLNDARALAQHTMDQQMIHFGSELSKANSTYEGEGRTRPFSVGSLHRHGMQPFSGFAEQPEYSHVGGVETYYYLMGDWAARDALYEAAQFVYRFETDDLITTAAVNGVDVLSRAAAVEYDVEDVHTRYLDRVGLMLARLQEDGTLDGLLTSPSSLNFIRALRGPAYHEAWRHDPEAAAVVLAAADVVVANAGAWELCEAADAVSLKLVPTIVNVAVGVAMREGQDPEPYRQTAQCMLELATLSQDGGSHAALTVDILESLPPTLEGWQWVYEEASPDSLLWTARQAAFRNDDMMGYHFYRNFEALMTGAGAIDPETPGLTPK